VVGNRVPLTLPALQPGGDVSRALTWATRLLGGAMLALVAGFVAFAITMAGFEQPAQSLNSAKGDAVVVLTGGELRVREGFRLFAGGAGRRLLISGVNRATSKDDLRRLSRVEPMLFDCCVDVGYLALDTIGNAAETRAWLKTWGFHRLVVVTSNYHMARSLMEIGRALPSVELVPHAVVSKHYQSDEWWKHPSAVKRVGIEYVKFLRSAARGSLAQVWGAPEAPGTFPGTFPETFREVPRSPVRDREVNSRSRQLSGL
jgi:uncharacterized SAM-binding protein YcdF (DUF218 family)